MDKFKRFFTLYVTIFLIFFALCQNVILRTISDSNPYIKEMNFIVNDYNLNIRDFKNNINSYINRMEKIKSGFSKLESPYLMKNYMTLQQETIKHFYTVMVHIKNNDPYIGNYIDKYNYYCNLSSKEINKILKTHFIKVTHLYDTSYYNIKVNP